MVVHNMMIEDRWFRFENSDSNSKVTNGKHLICRWYFPHVAVYH